LPVAVDLPVAVVLGAGVHEAAVGKWKIAAIYFAAAAFYAVLERSRREKVVSEGSLAAS
jgi:uncharacterized membrane protein